MIIPTQRLVIRSWSENDVEIYRALARDVGYNVFSLPGQFLTKNDQEIVERIRQRIEAFRANGLGKLILEDRVTREFVGTCGLEPYSLRGGAETVELGYRLCLKHWGKGFATEAAEALLLYGFGELKLPQIHALALPQNTASIRVIEKLGFGPLGDYEHAGLPHRLYVKAAGACVEPDARVVCLDHGQVSIPRGAEEQARAFYCDVLGLREIEKPESLRGRGGFWIQLGVQQIHFGVEDGVDRRATKAHLAYRVTRLGEWKKRLKSAGIEPLDGTPIPGLDRIEFRDPFGNRVELVSKA